MTDAVAEPRRPSPGGPPAPPPRRVGFYAPLKPPDHPVPSGDRAMARLLIRALEGAAYHVEPLSALRSFACRPDAATLAALEAAAELEIERLSRAWRAPGAAPPDVWFTYHPYYKAPDLIGPRLAERFGLPYLCAEASHAPKRARGDWAAWHGANARAIASADVQFCFTQRDRVGLAGVPACRARLVDLPPFIDAAPFGTRVRPSSRVVGLVSVAMMRPGDKSLSYAFLARALAALRSDAPWRLTVVGDGPARDDIRAMFEALPPERLCWRGLLPLEGIARVLAESDLYVWPGFGEAYGLAYLEAAAAGLPAVAMDCAGVASVVVNGCTGLLSEADDLPGFVHALARCLGNPGLRRRLGENARRFVSTERTVSRAAAILRDGIEGALARAGAPP